MARLAGPASAAAVVVAALLLLAQAAAAAASSFVGVTGTHLTLDGAPFFFVGGNAYWMTDLSAGQGNVDAALGAASAVGMRVVRTWAFGDQLPSPSTGAYDFSHLDYVVSSAARHSIRLVFALGNTWIYGGPEKWLAGDGGAAGKTIADFYASAGARAKYRAHIATVASRYAGDPTVLAWDVINEPRCPGCNGGQLAARSAWLDEMVAAVRASAPNQLVLLASEGFFGSGSAHESQNPGAGSACEGEDWEADSIKADAATIHTYHRQIEGSPDLGWKKPSFDAYIPYLAARVDLHERVAQEKGKPLIVEEFGLTARFFDADQTKAAVAVTLDRVVASKQRGGALAGALIWGLVPPGGGGPGGANQAGYNVNLDGGASASDVGLGSEAFGGGGGGGAAAAPNATSGGGANGGTAPNASPGGGRRRLRQSAAFDPAEDQLDAFRRGPQRASCANARASGWSFPYSFGEATGVNAEAVKARVSGTTISSLFKEAASKL